MVTKEKKVNFLFWIIAMISFLNVFILMILSNTSFYVINSILLWILGAIYFFLFNYFVCYKLAFKSFLKEKRKVIIAFLTLIATGVTVILLPFHYEQVLEQNFYNKQLKLSKQIVFTSSGMKNEKSQGYDIMLNSVKKNNRDYNLYEMRINAPWEFIDDRPVLKVKSDAYAILDISGADSCRITMKANKTSGILKIASGDFEKNIDLYSPEEKIVDINLKKLFHYHQTSEKQLFKVLYYIVQYLLRIPPSFTVIIYIKKYFSRKL